MNNEDRIVAERKKAFTDFFKKRPEIWIYVCLILLVLLSIHIRTQPMKDNFNQGHPGLWDVTTDSWTLGPDLDPFLFLRWAEEINSQGSLAEYDNLRYVPIGFKTTDELIFHVNLMVWGHKIFSAVGLSESMTQSAVIYPVVMFALTVIVFFLLARKMFLESFGKTKAALIAIISSLFLVILPPLLPRTIAGIPEKEASGFFFLFLALYWFICSWKSKSVKAESIYALLTGLATAGMALVWGGYIYIVLTISLALYIAFFLGQTNKRKLASSLIWIITTIILMKSFSTRFGDLTGSTIFLIAFGAIALIGLKVILFETKLKDKLRLEKWRNIPNEVIVLFIFLILGLVGSIVLFGPGYIVDKAKDITKPLITPISDRLGVTVAENRQPYFNEWESSFGPEIAGFGLFFWTFMIGSVFLYYYLLRNLGKKYRILGVLGYSIFLLAIVFSRYSPDSALNGTNGISIIFYLLGVLALIGSFGYMYYHYFKSGRSEELKSLDFGIILLYALFFFSVVSARGSVRTIMVLVPSAAIVVGFFLVYTFEKSRKANTQWKTFANVAAIILLIVALYSAWYSYQASVGTAKSFIPSPYTQQWQGAMSWVRDNTPANAVFAHWWDYGYWVQSIGKRATMLDGGNFITYWNHLMGRHGLTSPDKNDALELFYSHNVTHFLIDSTDIGKYSAFSSIGSDENYDRASYIPTYLKDYTQQRETKNGTLYAYTGGVALDSDIIYTLNGTQVFLPAGRAGLGAVLIEVNAAGEIVSAPRALIVYRNQQYDLPLRYAYLNKKMMDFGSGVEAGVFIFPRVVQDQIDKTGALLYLSDRTVHSQLARYYLYGEQDQNFRLAHSEDDFIVAQVKAMGNVTDSDFLFYNEFRGPIKIWEINYPQGMSVNPEYLRLDFPNKLLNVAR